MAQSPHAPPCGPLRLRPRPCAALTLRSSGHASSPFTTSAGARPDAFHNSSSCCRRRIADSFRDKHLVARPGLRSPATPPFRVKHPQRRKRRLPILRLCPASLGRVTSGLYASIRPTPQPVLLWTPPISSRASSFLVKHPQTQTQPDGASVNPFPRSPSGVGSMPRARGGALVRGAYRPPPGPVRAGSTFDLATRPSFHVKHPGVSCARDGRARDSPTPLSSVAEPVVATTIAREHAGLHPLLVRAGKPWIPHAAPRSTKHPQLPQARDRTRSAIPPTPLPRWRRDAFVAGGHPWQAPLVCGHPGLASPPLSPGGHPVRSLVTRPSFHVPTPVNVPGGKWTTRSPHAVPRLGKHDAAGASSWQAPSSVSVPGTLRSRPRTPLRTT